MFLWGRLLVDIIMHPGRAALVILLIAVLTALLAIECFFLRALSRALECCSPQSRVVSPGTVWWLLIPLFNLFLGLFFVWAINKSLRNEFSSRSSIDHPATKPWAGVMFSICAIVSLFTTSTLQESVWWFGYLLVTIQLASWVIYWRAISRCAKNLAAPSHGTAGIPTAATVGLVIP
jgi:uncharacterized membrane protein YcfT